MSKPLSVVAAAIIACSLMAGIPGTGVAIAQTQPSASQPAGTGLKARTKETWAQMKARWAKQKERWAECQRQGKAQGLTGRKSRLFLEKCMS